MPKPDEDMFPDPEPGNEDDPEYKEELFNTMKAMGWKPEDLTNNPKGAAEYARWLKRQQREEEKRG